MTTPQITVAVLTGTDDTLVRVEHADGQQVTFRVAADRTVGQFTTWDVTGSYADCGHDVHEDRLLARRELARGGWDA